MANRPITVVAQQESSCAMTLEDLGRKGIGPAEGVRISLEYVRRDSVSPVGEMVRSKRRSGGEVP